MAKSKRHKFKGKPRPNVILQQPATTGVEVMPKVNLGFMDAVPLRMKTWNVVQIIVVGCGGIGSYITQHIGRLMRTLYQTDHGAHLTLVDPDVVTYENIGRQLFCDAEEGMPKAEALNRRYSQAWGLNSSYIVGKFDESLIMGMPLTIIVGCVDNPAARATLAQVLEHNPEFPSPTQPPNFFWIDCGNLKDTGRVLVGSAANADGMRGAFQLERCCFALPGPALQSPGLLEPVPEDQPGGDMSCAQMAAANLQSLNVNSAIAVQGADILTRMLLTKDLMRFECQLNLLAGTMTSKYNTIAEVNHVIHRAPGFLMTKDPDLERQRINFSEFLQLAEPIR